MSPLIEEQYLLVNIVYASQQKYNELASFMHTVAQKRYSYLNLIQKCAYFLWKINENWQHFDFLIVKYYRIWFLAQHIKWSDQVSSCDIHLMLNFSSFINVIENVDVVYAKPIYSWYLCLVVESKGISKQRQQRFIATTTDWNGSCNGNYNYKMVVILHQKLTISNVYVIVIEWCQL